MPLKTKKLKAALAQAGFNMRSGKGSHTFWQHPHLPEVTITVSGKDGRNALRKVGKAL
jgi:predicted RNA binding protein YcfA (HicA-like mRNA interferase family)